MPGSVGAALTEGRVLPHSLSKAFSHRRVIACQENRYRNGESQAGLLVSAGASRLAWSCPRRLTATAMATLRAFYETCAGPQKAFYFYDLVNHKEAIYDPTGASVTGRYVVRFEGQWQQTAGLGRLDASVSLIEMA